MPTPLEIILDPLSLMLMAVYAGLIVWEMLFPARKLVRVKHWQARGLAAFVFYFLFSTYLPLLWDGTLAQYRLFDLTGLGTIAQFALGLLCYEFFHYWYHRAMHRFTPLWRSFHQMHHSAERLDTFGAFWLSPLDIAGFTFVGSFALVFVVGLGAQAATAVLFALFFFAVFQHTNVKTPRWLGYLVQRPESHSHHHGTGIHRDNYADLPLFDILFGTFKNPKEFLDTGFYHGASSRVWEMLLWKEVDKPKTPEAPAIGQAANS